jgi:thiamine biosynthesis lipoprotein
LTLSRISRKTGVHFSGKCSGIRRARPLLGTFVEIVAGGAAPPAMEAAVDAAFEAIARVHRLMSFHDPDSDVSRLNRDAATRAVAVDAWTFRVLEAAAEMHHGSGGLFDIAVADLLQHLGLLPRPGGPPPCPAHSAADGRDIALMPGRRVRFRRAGVTVDLGGIAKGFAVDRAVDVLRDRGMPRGLVNAGGDLAAFGPEPHTAHIRDPRDPQRLLALIDLRNEALASSGGRFDPAASLRPMDSAIVDPRNRQPARDQGDWIWQERAAGSPSPREERGEGEETPSVPQDHTRSPRVREVFGATVRAPTCMTADALTKVVMLAGASSAALLDRYRASGLVVGADGVRVTADWQSAVRLAA